MIEFEKLYLPWSARRYVVTCNGKILNSDGQEIVPVEKDGHLQVELEWILGRRFYCAASLTLVAFGMVKLPDHLFDEVVPLYRDGSNTNLSLQNLLFKFKTVPLPVENHEGFYHIPTFASYGISRNGTIINIFTGKYKSWSETKEGGPKNQTGGYQYTRVVNDRGFSKVLFKHRAMWLAFKEFDNRVDDLVINHKDGDPKNNDLDNLELVTYLENNLHAVATGLRSDNRAVLSKNLRTGEITRFPSMSQCCRNFGYDGTDFVRRRIRSGQGKLYPDYLVFKYEDDEKDWPVVDMTRKVIIGDFSNVLARNVFTGEVLLFNSASQAANVLDLKEATVRSHCQNGTLIPIMGWNFKYASNNTEWPKHTERHLRVYEKFPNYPPDGFIVYDTETNSEEFFESFALACQKFKVSKYHFRSLANSDKLYQNRYKLKFFLLRENLGPL